MYILSDNVTLAEGKINSIPYTILKIKSNNQPNISFMYILSDNMTLAEGKLNSVPYFYHGWEGKRREAQHG